ncbi:MAG: hypothetical protein GY832_06430 [Chloroflexi bacterium]|nr:hypothetical protein [Chloroflexota bacterium]
MQFEEILKNLGKVSWKELRQAHGNASHVPQAIRDLVSERAHVRKSAYWKLDNFVVLQGDLYEAAAYVPPFLISILKSSVPHGRDLVLDVLYEIGNGCAILGEKLRIQIDSQGRINEYDPDDAPTIQHACRKAVLEGVEYYLRELETSSPSNRAASQLVSSLPEQEEAIRLGLERILKTSQDKKLVSLIKETLKNLDECVETYRNPTGEWEPWL